MPPITDEQIINTILVHEGGRYTNDPNDAGGPTRWGITLPVLSKHLGRKATIAEVMNLSRETAALIYRGQFVVPFAALPDPLRVNVIDMGVNAGQTRAVYLLQQTIGAEVDGKLGPATIRLASVGRDWNNLFTGVRLAFYEDLIIAKPMNIKWRNGWRNRALSFIDVRPRMLPLKTPRWNTPARFGQMGKAY